MKIILKNKNQFRFYDCKKITNEYKNKLLVMLIVTDGRWPINLVFGNKGSSETRHLWNWISKVVGCKIFIGLIMLDKALRQSSVAVEIRA